MLRAPCSTQPRRQLRLVEPRLRAVRRRLPVRSARRARHGGPARQVGAAVATVEGDLDLRGPLG